MTGRSRDDAQVDWGPFRRAEILHEGRQARTWLAVRTRDGALLSLKTLQPFADVQEQRDALMQEAELQGRCRHPGVVRVLDAGRFDVGSYIAREYVEGLTLGELRRSVAEAGSRVPDRIVAAIGVALLSALACVHDQRDREGRALGLVHRDVTPANVLVGLDGVVRLTDFGLSYAPALHGTLSDEELVQGTLRYLPPEVARGEPPDQRADLFQFALCVAEMLGGTLRHRAPSLAELAGEDLRAAADRIQRGGAVLARGVAPRPAERFGSASEMATAWAAAFDGTLPRPEGVAEWLRLVLPERSAAERGRSTRARSCS